MFTSWFLLNLSSLKYNFNCFLAYPRNGRTRSGAGAWCPICCSCGVSIRPLGWELRLCSCTGPYSPAKGLCCTKKRDTTFFLDRENSCKFRKCETGIGIHGELAVLGCWVCRWIFVILLVLYVANHVYTCSWEAELGNNSLTWCSVKFLYLAAKRRFFMRRTRWSPWKWRKRTRTLAVLALKKRRKLKKMKFQNQMLKRSQVRLSTVLDLTISLAALGDRFDNCLPFCFP